jgi:hypothetical protein
MKVSDERRTVTTRTAALAAALALLLIGVAAVASGCGSSSTDDGVAALDDSSETTSESDGQTENAEEDPEEAALAWAKCMREHGIDVPDPEVNDGGGLTIRGGPGQGLDRIDGEKFRKAQEECGAPFGRTGRPPLSDEQREQLQETMLEFAKCMREHGVDMPDPEFSGDGGGGLFRVGPGPGRGRFDRDSEAFRKAQQACDEILEDAFPDRPGGRPNAEVGVRG